MAQLSVHLATSADLDSLVNLRARFLAEVANADASDPQLLLALRRYFTAAIPAGTFIAFLASIGPAIVGTSGLVFHTHPPTLQNLSGREAYLLNIFTLPKYRKRGIASLLLKKLLDHARDQGCSRVSLHAVPDALPLYQSAGFTPTENEMNLLLPPKLPTNPAA